MPSTPLQPFLQLRSVIRISLWSPSPDHVPKVLLYSSFPSESACTVTSSFTQVISICFLDPACHPSSVLSICGCVPSLVIPRGTTGIVPTSCTFQIEIFLCLSCLHLTTTIIIYSYIYNSYILQFNKKVFCGPKRIYSVCRKAWIQISSMHIKS